jgi:hypothetical protein
MGHRLSGQEQHPISESFPAFHEDSSTSIDVSPEQHGHRWSDASRHRRESNASSLAGRLRSASRKFGESNLPKGAWDAAASIASSVPSVIDVNKTVHGAGLPLREEHMLGEAGRGSGIGLGGSPMGEAVSATNDSQKISQKGDEKQAFLRSQRADYTPGVHHNSATAVDTITQTRAFENGYHFPPPHTWQQSTGTALKALWRYFLTWQGFLVVIYALNVVAWGGMIFLLLCNAAPAMCQPSCDDINSPRRIWIEYDAQILTALFCVTGFGLIPWRFRDLYYLLRYRFMGDHIALRRLAGIHRDWFRLAGSETVPPMVGPENIEAEAGNLPAEQLPFPLKSIAPAPLTGTRAPSTPVWKLDFVIWMFVWNTFLQAVLSGIMWGLNRYDRPSWATGLFVALACGVAAAAGIMIFVEGKKVKAVEGVPLSAQDLEQLQEDEEKGILHANNLKGKLQEKPGKTGLDRT